MTKSVNQWIGWHNIFIIINIMQILISGSDGMIGSALSNYFLNSNHHVIGVDNQSRYGDITRPHHSHKNFESVQIDVKDLKKTKIKPVDVVIHCAYDIGGIKHWNRKHEEFYNHNHSISKSMINWLETHRPSQIIWLSSSQVYENDQTFPSIENLITIPTSGYAKEKLRSEKLCIESTFGNRVCILRPFNCVGPEESVTSTHDCHVAIDLARKIIKSKGNSTITLFGDGQQVRSFTVIDDFVKAVDMVVKQNVTGLFNVCGTHTMTIQRLAEIFWRLEYQSKPLIDFDYDVMAEDVRFRQGDDRAFRTVTGWRETYLLNDCLKHILDSVRTTQ